MTVLRRLALPLLAAATIALGCNKNATSTPSPEPTPEPGPGTSVLESGPHAAGIRVFNTYCLRCHTIGKGKKQGPDLANVASDPTHTPEWLGEYIRNPRGQKSDSRMPPFMGKINDDDFKALIEYLSSLK